MGTFNIPGRRRVRGVLLAAALAMTLALAGCKKELYGNLSERDCNEIVAALLEAHIPAQKASNDGGKTWSAMVDESEIVQAMAVLREHGLPARKYDDLGDLFKKDGLVSTPTEERVRFIYGMSQELSDTLSKIDGVVVARVHIVLPDNDPLATSVKPSSASVFIKYQPNANLSTLTPQIKNLVVHSIEGLSYDRVSVTSVPASPLDLAAAHSSGGFPLQSVAAGIFVACAGLLLAIRKRGDGAHQGGGEGRGEAGTHAVVDSVAGVFKRAKTTESAQ